MLILHGSFLPEKNNEASRFVIWGECQGQSLYCSGEDAGRPGTSRSASRARGSAARTRDSVIRTPHSVLGTRSPALRRATSELRFRPHPFAATGEHLVDAISEWWTEAVVEEVSVVAHLPTVKN